MELEECGHWPGGQGGTGETGESLGSEPEASRCARKMMEEL